MSDNRRYYTGIDPLVRVRAAQTKRWNATKRVAKMIKNAIGDEVPLPEGYKLVFGCIETPESALNQYGLSVRGHLMTPRSSGSVDNDWLRDLSPEKLLATTESVEKGVEKIEADLNEYVRLCHTTYADRLVKSAPALLKLTGKKEVAARLRDEADRLEKEVE